MESLYLLIPLSVLLVLFIVGLFGWALHNGQMDDLAREGERIFDEEASAVDGDQARRTGGRREFSTSNEINQKEQVDG